MALARRPFVVARDVAVCLLVGMLPSGCGWAARGVSQGALGGVHDYFTSPPTRDSARALIDSLGSYARFAYDRHAAPLLDSTASRLILTGRAAADSTSRALFALGEERLAVLETHFDDVLRNSLSDAIQELVRENIRAAGLEARGQGRLFARDFAAELDSAFAPRVQTLVAVAVAAATDSAAARFASRLGADLRDGLIAVADTVARVGARAAVEAADRAATQGTVARNIRIGLIVAGFIGLIVFVIWLIRDRRRIREALDIVTGSVHDISDTALSAQIRSRARARSLEPWLNRYLRERGFIVEHDRPGAGPSGPVAHADGGPVPPAP
jgi:hypothetical protein